MTNQDKRLLIEQAAKLVSLGLTVEKERSSLRKLVERGVPYSDPRMMQAYERFARVDNEWKHLEVEHLRRRKNLGIDLF